MSLVSDLTAIKTVHNGVKNNKVTRFAYTQQAYEGEGYDPDGVTTYDPNAQQNIPVSDLSVIKINPTVRDKGYRARASSITRMLLNHFFGRVSFNLNKVNDLFNSMLDSFISYVGQANGLATLDSNGRIPYEQLPESAVENKGAWNAQTNTPTLHDGIGDNGDTYTVTVAGVQDLGSGNITFFVNDRVIYNGSVWQRFPAGDTKTVCEIAPNSATGNVDLSQQTDITKILHPSIIERILVPFIGAVWAKLTNSLSAYTVYDITFANGIWVACTSQDIFYSTDNGATWNQASTSAIQNTAFVSIVYGKGVFLAISYTVGAWWSADGDHWTKCTGTYTATFSDETYTVDFETLTIEKPDLFFDGDKFYLFAEFVITTTHHGTYYSNPPIWSSENGKDFIFLRTVSYYGTTLYPALNCINDRLMYGYYNYVYAQSGSSSSVNVPVPLVVKGITHSISIRYSGSSAGMLVIAVCYAKGVLVFTTRHSEMGNVEYKTYYSLDLSTCSLCIKSGTNTALRLDYITFVGNSFIGKDENGLMWTSIDGINFSMTQVALDSAVLYKVVDCNGIYLALTNKGIYKSFDGCGWTKSDTAEIANIAFKGAGFGNNMILAGAESNGIYKSDYTMVAI